MAKKLKEEELRLLFNDGIANQYGKKKSDAAATAKAMGVTEKLVDVDELDLGSSTESEEEEIINSGTNAQYEVNNEVGSVEIFKEKTIEDLIEEQRAALAAQGKVGTPVTEDSFSRW